MAEDGGAHRQQVFGPLSSPTHAWTAETGLELFGGAFDHAGAEGPPFFAFFEVVHSLLVVLEVAASRKGTEACRPDLPQR